VKTPNQTQPEHSLGLIYNRNSFLGVHKLVLEAIGDVGLDLVTVDEEEVRSVNNIVFVVAVILE
jgi:hypothetical protein